MGRLCRYGRAGSPVATWIMPHQFNTSSKSSQLRAPDLNLRWLQAQTNSRQNWTGLRGGTKHCCPCGRPGVGGLVDPPERLRPALARACDGASAALGSARMEDQTCRQRGRHRDGRRGRATAPKHRAAESGGRGGEQSSTPTRTASRIGSKQSLLVARLSEPAGARIADLTKELNWLPHTVRAALTRLRQQGYAVTRSKSEEGVTVYRATQPATKKKRNRAAAKTAA